MVSPLLRAFASPGAAYRGKPFWAWNGALNPDELRRQVRVMHQMGLGGFFMHARVGLATPYLSDEWFAGIRACVEEARTLGMEAWLYDEDRWPSGAAGGLVTADPQYRMRSLVVEELTNPKALEWTDDVVAVFTAQLDGTNAASVRRLPPQRRPRTLEEGVALLVFRCEVEKPSDWYNGATYLDTLNPAAVRQFLAVTHEAYAARFGKDFGTVIPGIFTDEPNHGAALPSWSHRLLAPWTDALPAVFQERYGYDLLPRLVELFYDVNGQPMTPARYHYHDCITHLFVDAFARQTGAWCEEHGLQFTGHVLAEETLSSQTEVVGNGMRFYEHMQTPGIDTLTEYTRQGETAKQVSSVARQCGRPWRLTETYGCTGWDFPFAGHKALGDWQVAWGINLRCQHLSYYTMAGEAKRDYPASILDQSPWWDLYPTVEDYFARVHLVMTQGEEVRDLLVIHPIESMWVMCKKGWANAPETAALDWVPVNLRNSLLAQHLDFDYGDEEMLGRLAQVRTRNGLPTLEVGKAVYTGILVPPLKTIRHSTMSVLKRFRRAGGLVVFAGDPPRHVDAKPSDEAFWFAKLCTQAPADGEELAQAVESTRRVSITDPRGQEIAEVLYLLREDRNAYYLFACNTGHDARDHGGRLNGDVRVAERTAAFPEVTIRGFADCTGTPIECDATTGQVYTAEAEQTARGWTIHTSFPVLGSRLFIIPKRPQIGRLPARPALTEVRRTMVRREKWPITLTEPNVLVLDRARFQIGDRGWRKAEEILRIDRTVRLAMGMLPRGGGMVQPWARPPVKEPTRLPVRLEYTFDVRELPTGPLALALERPEHCQISVNDVPVPVSPDGHWVDRSLCTVPFAPELLHHGRNTLELTVDYTEEHPGLEIVYLLGNFGVSVTGMRVALTAPPTTLKVGDWTEQGLPFYSGNVTYQTTLRAPRHRGERLFLQVPAYQGAAVRIRVGGKVAGVIAWEPNELDITDLVQEEHTDLALDIIGHRRNSHGPLHLVAPHPEWVGPSQFVSTGDGWQDEYHLVPCGLLAQPILIVRK